MSKRGGKTKSGEPQLKELQDKGENPLIQESPNSGRDAAVKSPADSSSIAEEDGVQSEHADDCEEIDDGGRSSQASEENSTPNKKKKVKKGREGEQKDGVMEGAEQPKRNRSASFFDRLKKRSHGSQPLLSADEAQQPQRRHTHSEGSNESEVSTNGGATSREGIKKISVDSQGAENSQLKELNKDLAKKIEEYEVLQNEFDAAKENIKREQQMIDDQKGTILNLRHEIRHLEDQLNGYDSMHAEVTRLKESAGGMLRRLRSLLGKNEGDCSMGFEELTKKMDELMSEVEAQKVQTQVYKEDFEAEREARAEAAGRKVEEIAVIQNLYSEAVEERKSAQGQLAKALEELEKARGELEDSKKLLQDTIDGAAKNLEDLKATHEREMNTCVENAGKIHNQKEMKAELAKKDRRITNLEEERDQLARDRDQLRENRDEIKQERDDLKKENEALDDQRKAKEKEAELNAAQKNQLQNEVQQLREQSRSVTESLQTEIREVKEQLTVALADKEALGDESLAKTQQVKQYKKQVDNFRIQLAESNAKIEQCEQQINNLRIQLAESNSRIEQYQTRLRQSESDLEYCRRDLQAREEDGESKTMAAENKKLRDEVLQLKRTVKQQFVAVATSSSQESPAVRDRSRSPSPVAVIKPITQSPKPQPPYGRQASAGPIMVHAIPPVQNMSPSLPHAYYHNNQQQQINFMENVKIREDTYVTDNPQTIKYKYKSDARDEEDEHDDRPFDPNLVCAACNKQFRIGEIQEFRKHYKSCKMKEIKEETTDLDPPRHNIIMAGDTQPFTPILPSMESDQDLVSSTSEPKLLCRTPGCSFKGYEHLRGYCRGCSGQGTIQDDQY